jgi:hypothetical protein
MKLAAEVCRRGTEKPGEFSGAGTQYRHNLMRPPFSASCRLRFWMPTILNLTVKIERGHHFDAYQRTEHSKSPTAIILNLQSRGFHLVTISKLLESAPSG